MFAVTSKAIGGAPVLSLPPRRALLTVSPTPVPPTPHPVHHSHHSHPSHPCNNYVSSSSHYYPIKSSRYDPAPVISSDTAIRYDPASQYSRYNPASQYTIRLFLVILHILLVTPHLIFHPFPAASTARNLLSSSAAAYYAAFFASDLDDAVSKANFLAFLIASPTGQSLCDMCKCLTDPHLHCFC